MRKVLFLSIAFLLASGNFYAQNAVNFKVQEDGTFVNESDGKKFAILSFEGISKNDLYAKTLIGITKIYNSPKDVISKVEGDMISVNGIRQDCINYPWLFGSRIIFSIDYVLQFQFKDGKVRVEAPVITRCYNYQYQPDKLEYWIKAQKLFKNGEPNPKRKDVINDINTAANEIINNILKNLDENSDENNW
ncbi:hypothetical protein [Tannerella forsythia]|uniref:hypothetical protein n=1 Tax=Tannerella forsythia TaxID=28112 RepID=UPI000AD8CF04|nr:hypothetical protein [Tannerella forsythia]